MLSNLFSHKHCPLVLNLQLPFHNGSAEGFPSLKAVSNNPLPQISESARASVLIVFFIFLIAEKLLRTDMAKDMEGFFIALFERNTVNFPKKTLLTNGKISVPNDHDQIYEINDETKLQKIEGLGVKKKTPIPLPLKMSHRLLQRRNFPNIRRQRTTRKH